MKFFALFFFLSFVVGCSTADLIGEDGWPVRCAAKRMRCPENTTLIDNRLSDGTRQVFCKKGENPLPYGFEIIWYPDGTLSSIYTTNEEGMPISKLGYYPEGTKRSEEMYTDGKVSASRAFFEDGRIKYEAISKGGITSIRRISIDGSVILEGKRKNGRREGVWKEYVDGAEEFSNYLEGIKNGEVKRTYMDISVETGHYQHGVRVGTWKRMLNGKEIHVIHYRKGELDGISAYFFPNGGMRETGLYRAGQKAKKWVVFYPSGQLQRSGSYACGKPHGLWRSFHSLGQKASEGEYFEGEKVGHWNYWNEEGHLLRSEDFEIKPITESPCRE